MRKIYFHGGGGMDQEMSREPFYIQLEKIFNEEKITQVLHVPFARLGVGTKAYRWTEGWFQERFPKIQFLNALYREELQEVDLSKTFVLITGGSDKMHLYLTIRGNTLLEKIIRETPYLLGSSAGMMVLGKHFRSHKDYKVTHPGLGLFNFVGEGHSSEQNKQPHLEHHLQRFPDLDFVLGIDEDTVVEIDETGKIIDSWGAGTYSYRPGAGTKQDTVDGRDERNNALTRSIHCTSYIHALQILNSLTSLIEQEGHHPDISIRNYKELVLSLTTHDEGYSVTEKDRRLARIINKHLIVIENEVQPIS